MAIKEGMRVRRLHIVGDGGMTLTKCSKCQVFKPLDTFYKNKANWDGLNGYCKLCCTKYYKVFNQQPKVKERMTRVTRERNQRIKMQAIEYKGNKCKDCGLTHIPNYNSSVFQFHHRDPKKKDYAMSQTSKGFDNIKPELDKCDLLCANCHHILHWAIDRIVF